MHIDIGQPLKTLPRTSPLEELKRYFNEEIKKASLENKEYLREALKKTTKILEEEGAW
jgi:hypothetical protein